MTAPMRSPQLNTLLIITTIVPFIILMIMHTNITFIFFTLIELSTEAKGVRGSGIIGISLGVSIEMLVLRGEAYEKED